MNWPPLLRMPKSWVYEKARQRRIPHLKPGKRLLFRSHEVLAWFEQEYLRAPLALASAFRGPGKPILARRRQLTPNAALGGRRGDRPRAARVSGDGPGAVAVALPSENVARGRE